MIHLERRDLLEVLSQRACLPPAIAVPHQPIFGHRGRRAASGAPHQGKTLALITPHLDDGPFFACGRSPSFLREGYTGYFIRTSNDEKDSYDLSLGRPFSQTNVDAKASWRRPASSRCLI